VIAGAAYAQIPTSGNVFVGYSFSRSNGVGNTTNLNGWETSLEGKFLPWIGIVADFGGGYGSGGLPVSSISPCPAYCNSSANLRRYTYLFGPRVSVPVGRFTPFAHGLFGAAHTNVSGFTDTSFATAIGGGLDYRLIHGVAWRFQADALHTNLYGQSGNYFRFSTGIDFRF
jgi:peptidoglycan-associated lipoprotein